MEISNFEKRYRYCWASSSSPLEPLRNEFSGIVRKTTLEGGGSAIEEFFEYTDEKKFGSYDKFSKSIDYLGNQNYNFKKEKEE